MNQSDRPAATADSRHMIWTKRILAGSFLFFLLKGLAWLAAGAVAAYHVF